MSPTFLCLKYSLKRCHVAAYLGDKAIVLRTRGKHQVLSTETGLHTPEKVMPASRNLKKMFSLLRTCIVTKHIDILNMILSTVNERNSFYSAYYTGRSLLLTILPILKPYSISQLPNVLQIISIRLISMPLILFCY